MRDCEEIDGAVVEQLGGAEYIRVAHTYNQEMLRLFNRADKRRKSEVRHHFEMSLYGVRKAVNEGLFHILVLALATYLAIHQRISFGDVLTFSVLFLNVMSPLNEVHRVLDEGHEASLRVGDLLQMLQSPLDQAFNTPDRECLALTKGRPMIEVEDLLVQYVTPDGRNRRALDHLSLTIYHGETIGIAGRSGSGKSTWIKVLLRLLHPQAGRILLGGRPLEDVSRTELAKLVSYVGQNPFVFSGTVFDNIAYGNGEVSLEQVQHAAELANLHEEILQMPSGYYAEVTERGQNLSGGQRQRLAIARLLLKNAPILILDEATRSRQYQRTSRPKCAGSPRWRSNNDHHCPSTHDAKIVRSNFGRRRRSHQRGRNIRRTCRPGGPIRGSRPLGRRPSLRQSTTPFRADWYRINIIAKSQLRE